MIKTLLLSLVLLALCVPWWFSGTGDGPVLFGMPGWALFAVGASLAYACAISWFLCAQWREDEEDESDDGAP